MIGQSRTQHFREKLPADDPRYKHVVAVPVMHAVDEMPAEWRALVHEFGYVDVYRAWRKGWTPERVRERARNGTFTL